MNRCICSACTHRFVWHCASYMHHSGSLITSMSVLSASARSSMPRSGTNAFFTNESVSSGLSIKAERGWKPWLSSHMSNDHRQSWRTRLCFCASLTSVPSSFSNAAAPSLLMPMTPPFESNCGVARPSANRKSRAEFARPVWLAVRKNWSNHAWSKVPPPIS